MMGAGGRSIVMRIDAAVKCTVHGQAMNLIA
jgi:hypothetical protein